MFYPSEVSWKKTSNYHQNSLDSSRFNRVRLFQFVPVIMTTRSVWSGFEKFWRSPSHDFLGTSRKRVLQDSPGREKKEKNDFFLFDIIIQTLFWHYLTKLPLKIGRSWGVNSYSWKNWKNQIFSEDLQLFSCIWPRAKCVLSMLIYRLEVSFEKSTLEDWEVMRSTHTRMSVKFSQKFLFQFCTTSDRRASVWSWMLPLLFITSRNPRHRRMCMDWILNDQPKKPLSRYFKRLKYSITDTRNL